MMYIFCRSVLRVCMVYAVCARLIKRIIETRRVKRIDETFEVVDVAFE